MVASERGILCFHRCAQAGSRRTRLARITRRFLKAKGLLTALLAMMEPEASPPREAAGAIINAIIATRARSRVFGPRLTLREVLMDHLALQIAA